MPRRVVEKKFVSPGGELLKAWNFETEDRR
jgi:hypothetical protein